MTLQLGTICPREIAVSGWDTGRKSSQIQRMTVTAAEGDWKKMGCKEKKKQQQTESFDAPTALKECQWGHCHKTLKIESEEKVWPFLFFWEALGPKE